MLVLLACLGVVLIVALLSIVTAKIIEIFRDVESLKSDLSFENKQRLTLKDDFYRLATRIVELENKSKGKKNANP